MFLTIPYTLALIGIPGLMVVPYYYLNRYLLNKLQPRRNARQLLLFFFVAILFTFIYMSVGIWLVVWVAKQLNK